MKLWAKRAAILLALVLVYASVINAPWLAPEPVGAVKLLAHGATAQQVRRDAEPVDCAARAIEAPLHPFIEDTAPSILKAAQSGAQMVELHVATAKGGQLVLFPDETLDCRTDGHGRVADYTVEELKALDAGFGYTADGGKTFPLRGRGKGLIPTRDETLHVPRLQPALFNLGDAGPEVAARLIAALDSAKRDVAAKRDGFRGTPAALARIRAQYPEARI